MMNWRNTLFLVVLALSIIIYHRKPEEVDPSPAMCGKVEVHEAALSRSDFLPGICRRVKITHQQFMTSDVYDCGPDTNEKSVVLLHGFPDNAKTWRKQVEPLVLDGYRVIIPTLRGYDTSSQVGDYHISTIAADVLCIMKSFSIHQFDVIGHDWGAVVAHALAISNPNSVRALISVAVPPQMVKFGAKTVWAFPRQLLLSSYMFFFQIPFLPDVCIRRFDFLIHHLVSSWSPNFDWHNDPFHHLKEIYDTFAVPGVAHAALGYYRQNAVAFLFDAFAKLANGNAEYLSRNHTSQGLIPVDTLLVTGRSDGCILTEIYEDLDNPQDQLNIPFGELFTVGAHVETRRLTGGHFVHYENPNDFNEHVLSFFSRMPKHTRKHSNE